MPGIGIDVYLQIRTYSPYPGYQLHGEASGLAPGWAYLSHSRAFDVYSSCNWVFPHDIGPAPLTCQYRR